MTYVPLGTQRDVITSTADVTVVLGGAGTGKTITAAAVAAAHLAGGDTERERQRRAMLEAEIVPRLPPRARALFLSFSRTAVSQVIDRAATVVGPLLKRIDVATFDGFAWRVINDFGAPYGYPPPLTILSRAERKVPGALAGMTYDDLVPAAMHILGRAAVADYYTRRYSLVICDEFQDTDDEEWAFMQGIAPPARRILLGDVNQCIYAELKRIDPAARIALALALPGAVRVDLPPASHRDPSGVLPAAADAARLRRFNDDAVTEAVVSGRLCVTRTTEACAHATIIKLIKAARAEGHSISLFTHTNASTAAVSDALTTAAIRHEQVGLSEAYGEALNAQLAMLRYAIDGTPGRRALAVYFAANYRGDAPLVQKILEKSNPTFERGLRRVLADLKAAVEPQLQVDRLAEVITLAFSRIGTHRGQQTWTDAARHTRAAVRLLAAGKTFSAVEEEVRQARHAALVGDVHMRPQPVQVMNLHQTKGREADASLLLLQREEYHGREVAPYPKLSRLLYVVLTRARHRAHIVVPEMAHPLWEPLVEACEAAAGSAPAAH